MAILGEQLRAARRKKGVTASQAAAATRIKIQTIEGLENDDFSSIAATVYCKGFIKMYAEYLGLDPAPLIEDYLSQCGGDSSVPPTSERYDQGMEHRPNVPGRKVPMCPNLRFRSDLLDARLQRIRVCFLEEPVKCLVIALAILIVLAFLLSGLVRYAGL